MYAYLLYCNILMGAIKYLVKEMSRTKITKQSKCFCIPTKLSEQIIDAHDTV